MFGVCKIWFLRTPNPWLIFPIDFFLPICDWNLNPFYKNNKVQNKCHPPKHTTLWIVFSWPQTQSPFLQMFRWEDICANDCSQIFKLRNDPAWPSLWWKNGSSCILPQQLTWGCLWFTHITHKVSVDNFHNEHASCMQFKQTDIPLMPRWLLCNFFNFCAALFVICLKNSDVILHFKNLHGPELSPVWK